MPFVGPRDVTGFCCTKEVCAGPAAGNSDLSCSTIHTTALATAIMMPLPATTIAVIRAGVSRCIGQSSPSSSDHAVCASVSSTPSRARSELPPSGQRRLLHPPLADGIAGTDKPSAKRKAAYGEWTVSTLLGVPLITAERE